MLPSVANYGLRPNYARCRSLIVRPAGANYALKESISEALAEPISERSEHN
jgi:hypothetical protein